MRFPAPLAKTACEHVPIIESVQEVGANFPVPPAELKMTASPAEELEKGVTDTEQSVVVPTVNVVGLHEIDVEVGVRAEAGRPPASKGSKNRATKRTRAAVGFKSLASMMCQCQCLE